MGKVYSWNVLLVVIYIVTLVSELQCRVSNSKLYLDRTDGRYKDILVVIHSDVHEDPELLLKIKNGFSAASLILKNSTASINSTGKSFAFGKVHILVPSHWSNQYVDGTASWERSEAGDYLVTALGFPSRDGHPHSVQPEGCGKSAALSVWSAKYIKSSDALTVSQYLVHEFAHLRWGVFDEFNNMGPHYYVENGQIVPLSCSNTIEGRFFNKHTGEPCKPENNALPPACIFYPSPIQHNTNSSIMFAGDLKGVDQFCSAANHNSRAPNLHNKNCRHESVANIIAKHDDFTRGPNIHAETSVNFRVVREREAHDVMLIFDVSGSMQNVQNRFENLKFAAKYLIGILPLGVRVGMVTFSDKADFLRLPEIISSDTDRQKYVSAIDGMKAHGGTCIGCGLNLAMELLGVNPSNPSPAISGYMSLFSDGKDTTSDMRYEEARHALYNSSLTVDGISIGIEADKHLAEMAARTQGRDLLLTDSDTSTRIKEIMGELVKGRFSSSRSTVSTSLQLRATVNVDILDPLTKETEIKVVAMFYRNNIPEQYRNAEVTGLVYGTSSNRNFNIILRDDGNAADAVPDDGIYSAYILPSSIYEVDKYAVHVTCLSPKLSAHTDKFEVKSLKPGPPPILPPSRVSSLEPATNISAGIVTLNWTAVGNQMDVGTARSYTIRISTNFDRFQADFKTGTRMNVNPVPKESGEKMTQDLTKAQINVSSNVTFYIALIATSNYSLDSEPSNIVSAMLIEAEFNDTQTTTMPPDTTPEIETTLEPETTDEPEATELTTDELTTEIPSTSVEPEKTEPTSVPSTTTIIPSSTETSTDVTTTSSTVKTTEVTTETPGTSPPDTTHLPSTRAPETPEATSSATTKEITTAQTPRPSTVDVTEPPTSSDVPETPSTVTTAELTTRTTTHITSTSPSSTTSTTSRPPIGPDPDFLRNRQTALISVTAVLGVLCLLCVIYYVFAFKSAKLPSQVTPDSSTELNHVQVAQ